MALLDLGLPGQDGLEVLEAWRGQGIDFPVIILTAKTITAKERKQLEGGVSKIFEKGSCQRSMLLDEVTMLLDRAIERQSDSAKHNSTLTTTQ